MKKSTSSYDKNRSTSDNHSKTNVSKKESNKVVDQNIEEEEEDDEFYTNNPSAILNQENNNDKDNDYDIQSDYEEQKYQQEEEEPEKQDEEEQEEEDEEQQENETAHGFSGNQQSLLKYNFGDGERNMPSGGSSTKNQLSKMNKKKKGSLSLKALLLQNNIFYCPTLSSFIS